MPMTGTFRNEALGLESIYIQKIDIAERLGFLKYAIAIGEGRPIIGQILYDLSDYAQTRLEPQKSLFDHYAFPFERRKQLSEQAFRARVGAYLELYLAGMELDPSDIVDYLENWLDCARSNLVLSDLEDGLAS